MAEQNIDEALSNITEGAALAAPDLLEHYRTAIDKIFTTMTLLLDSRFGDRATVIRTAAREAEDSPVVIHNDTLDSIYSEAKTYVAGRIHGKVVMPSELGDRVSAFYDNGYDSGLTIPDWPNLAELYKIAKGELTVITGVPGHGKSSVMDAMAVRMAECHDWRWCMYSPENYPWELHVEKLISLYIGKPFHRGPTDRMTPIEVSAGLEWLNRHFVFIEPDEDNISLEAVLSLVDQTMESVAIDGVVIDPWNELESNRPTDQTETDYIGNSLRKVRRFARHRNVGLWIVAHPRKLQMKENGEGYVLPTPYDISGSAHWYNKADNCLTVYRHTDSVDVNVQKIKYKIRGKIGKASFTYDGPTGRLTPYVNPGEF